MLEDIFRLCFYLNRFTIPPYIMKSTSTVSLSSFL